MFTPATFVTFDPPGDAVLWLLRWNGWIPTVIRDGDVVRASAVMNETGQKHIVDGTDPFDTSCGVRPSEQQLPRTFAVAAPDPWVMVRRSV